MKFDEDDWDRLRAEVAQMVASGIKRKIQENHFIVEAKKREAFSAVGPLHKMWRATMAGFKI